MDDWAVKVVVLGFFAWVIWMMIQPRYTFEIRIRAGQVRVHRGKVSPAFLAVVAEVCKDINLTEGWVAGVPKGRRVSLRFSHHFPPGPRQRLRNEWQSVN